eukprot:m.155093 g.155093  ORF g.155093 m.155093 type:complete len:263 (-) comp14306_c1_seq1:81-869(-)
MASQYVDFKPRGVNGAKWSPQCPSGTDIDVGDLGIKEEQPLAVPERNQSTSPAQTTQTVFQMNSGRWRTKWCVALIVLLLGIGIAFAVLYTSKSQEYNKLSRAKRDLEESLVARLEALELVVSQPSSSVQSLPVGSVIAWHSTTFPTGWQKCDGTNGTPDLRGRFLYGADGRNTDYETLGETGGEETHTLTVDEMPRHDHKNGVYDRLLVHNGHGTITAVDSIHVGVPEPNLDSSGVIQAQGNNQPHSIMPPFYVLYFICRI